MSYTAEQLLSLSNSFEEFTSDSLVKSAKKKDEKKKFPFWLKNKGKKDSNSAKDKSSKKLDPKAEVRNRGDVCVPAEKAKDKKDHFPINSESQARNALAQVNKFTNAPEWYNGSLQSLVSLVAKKVKAKYPSIEVSKDAKTPGKKKASAYYNGLLKKFGQDPKPPAGTPGSPEYAAREENGGPGDPMELGDGNVDENGNQLRQTTSVTRNTQSAKPRYQSIPPDVQEALAKMNFKGTNGVSLVNAKTGKGDGQLGPNTQLALDAYVAKNKARMAPGMDKGEALYAMIRRDASGENKTTTFDHKATNDGLNNVTNFINQTMAMGQQTIKSQGLKGIQSLIAASPTLLTSVTYWESQLNNFVKNIDETLADQRSTQEEKTVAQSLKTKATPLITSMTELKTMFTQTPVAAPAAAPATTGVPATTPAVNPTTAALENEFFRKLGSKYIY